MNINQLRYLLKIAECGSITEAAQQLYISQPSLSKSIAQLEKEYGIQLLDRKPNGVILTPIGVKFLNCSKQVLEAANSLDFTFSDRGTEERSQLFVASQQFDFLYDMLKHTMKRNHFTSLFCDIVETDRSNVIRLVIERNVDIGIVVRTSTDAKSFLWQTDLKKIETNILDRAGVFACVGPKSPYYHREQITFSEAERCPQIALDIEPEAKMNYFFDRSKNHFNLNNITFFNSIRACEHFLLETDSLLFISKWTIGCFSGTPIRSVKVLPELDGEESPNTELIWIKRAGEPLNKIATQFVSNLQDHFEII